MKDIDNRDMINTVGRQLLTLMAEGTTQLEDSIYRVNTRDYLDPERFALEKATIFKQTPLIMGFTGELPNPGDFKIHDDTDTPILIVRNREGVAKAFLNACRHRGAKLADKPCGNQKVFVCPYHAWSYDTDGRLVGLASEQLFGDVDKAALALVELPCVEKYGLIFVVPTPGASLDVDAFLGAGAKEMAGWNLERNKPVGVRDLKTRANWKLALNTFVENYHFHILHSSDFGYKVKNCAYHWRFGDSNQHLGLAWPSESLEDLRGKPEAEWQDANSNFSILYFLYPNTIIALYPETCSVKHIYPGSGVDGQVTRMSFFSRDAQPSPEVEELIQQRFDVFHKVLQEEDYWVAGNVFRNMESGLLPEIIFGRNEPALHWMHEAFDLGIGLRPGHDAKQPHAA